MTDKRDRLRRSGKEWGEKKKKKCILQFSGVGNIPAEMHSSTVWPYTHTLMHVSNSPFKYSVV